MSAGGTTVWPNDAAIEAQELERTSPHRLVCFLLSAFDPPEIFDQVHDAVTLACNSCAQLAGIQIECRRADTLHEAKTIHDDIWRHIATADLLVMDVTGLNPNVMIEFGVAAALRRPQQVILIRDKADSSRLPFNAFAQRSLSYGRAIVGDQAFIGGLVKAMIQAVTPAPFRPTPVPSVPDRFVVDFRKGDRRDLVLSPGITHRRPVADGLEFGSFYIFRNSWLLLSERQHQNVRVRVRFRFLELLKQTGEAFLGVSLRNQHFHAEWGHMILFYSDGKARRTEPQDDLGHHKDIDIGQVAGFDWSAPTFVELIAEFSDTRLSFNVNGVKGRVSTSKMPYVFAAGYVRIATSLCRVVIQEIELKTKPSNTLQPSSRKQRKNKTRMKSRAARG